jgi:hypothetical protein
MIRVWRRRRRDHPPRLAEHRIERLEDEAAAASAGLTELRQRLDLLESVAAAAGAAPYGGVPAAPMPPVLLAAARDVHQRDIPVRLDVAGTDVVAVIGGAGDPREWWTTIWQLAAPAEERP